jgi:4-hydroxybenzoate polyprenyltransferase
MIFLTIIQLLRPHQWLKNLILFFPPFLGGVLLQPGMLQKGALPFLSFCLASSFTYILNDILDRDRDRLHPHKRQRAIASGVITVPVALGISVLLLVPALALAWSVSLLFFEYLALYLLVSAAYSHFLKDQPVFDIFCIASGFVLRLLAGGEAFGVVVSDWLFLSVLLLALFLSAGKRLGEQQLLGEEAGEHRQSLGRYPPGTLEAMMLISGAAVLVTYTLYVIAKHKLVYTVPLCCFGLFRYLLVVKAGGSGDPTLSLLKDPVLFVVGLVWALMVGVGVYG